MKITTTDDDVMRVLREVVAERPDYVYVNPNGERGVFGGSAICYYVHGDCPGCLIGHVLHRLGVPIDAMWRREHWPASVMAAEVLSGVSYRSTYALDAAQLMQDYGQPWSRALLDAEDRFAERL